MEALAADLWNPSGGYLPTKAAVNRDKIGHTNSACEIRNVQSAEPQSDVNDFTPSQFTLSLAGLSHAEQTYVGLECAHTTRGRSQPVHSDRGPSGDLHQNADAEL